MTGGMVFCPVWPPTEKEMAKFLFGLPPRRQWPLTYRRGSLAWVPLTALCRLVTWDATSHPRSPGVWHVIWGLRDDNVFSGEIERAFDPAHGSLLSSGGDGPGSRVQPSDDGSQASPGETQHDE